MTPDRWQAHPLRSSDRPQPVDRWQRDVEVVLFAAALLLVIAGLALDPNLLVYGALFLGLAAGVR